MMVTKSTRTRQRHAFGTADLFDEGTIEAVLKLASSSDIRTEEQAAELFAHLWAGRKPWSFETDSPTFDTSDWKAGQAFLQRWLPRIAGAHTLRESSAAALARDLSLEISSIGAGEPRVSRGGGSYILTVYKRDDSIYAASARAVLVFLPDYGWTSRLGECELKECDRWFLREDKPGTPKQYCGPNHAWLARARRRKERNV